MGTSLVRVSSAGVITTVGTIAGTGQVSLDYSTTYLCVVGGGKAYLCTASAVTQITDIDIGTPIDAIWVDGYFLFTDGAYLYVNELADPFAIDPLKYGASEIDPDRVVGLLKYRNEVYVLNRYTIEVFDNIGGSGFPFTRLPGGLIPKGCVGTKAKTLFAETIAWVGSARNEPCSVYMTVDTLRGEDRHARGGRAHCAVQRSRACGHCSRGESRQDAPAPVHPSAERNACL